MIVGFQGLGLFAARDLEKHTMVIEYIGELIRNEVAEYREKLYDSQVNLIIKSTVLALCGKFYKSERYSCRKLEVTISYCLFIF